MEHKKQVRTMEEEMARERKFWKQNHLWSLLLLAAVVLWSLFGGAGQSVALGADGLMLTMHDGKTAAIGYESITAAELVEMEDYGTPVEGKEQRGGSSGIWEHPQWGRYTLCVYASCPSAVRLQTAQGCYVVNLASEEETRQLLEVVQEKSPASR